MAEPRPAAGVDALYERHVFTLPPGSADVAVPRCPVCDAEFAAPLFGVEALEARVVRCRGCGLGRLHPLPTPDEVRSFYPDTYYGDPGTKFQPAVERLVRIAGERHIAFLSAGLPRGARVLDVGCGRGVILGPLADRGFEVHGVEISKEAALGADPRAEIRIAPHLVDAAYADGFFDQVVIWHVLEHLDDPAATLAEVHRILRPGGRLIVAVPNFSSLQARFSAADWFHLDLPRHLYHFPLPALRRLLVRHGFEVDSEHHFSLRQNPFGWIQSALNRLRGLPRNGLYALLHHRQAGDAPPFDAATRRRLWLGLLLLAPLALLLTLVETAQRSGATVHLVARRDASGSSR